MVFTFGTPLSYGILRAPLSDAFGVPVIELSVVFSVMLFTFFIGSGLIGVVAARLPARGIVLVCAVTTGLLAPTILLVDSIVGLLVVFAVLGLALGTVFVVLASVIPRWFDERRGAATGLIFVGNGLGLFVLPPLWQYAIDAVGIERAFLSIVGVSAVTFLAAGVVCGRPTWTGTSASTLGEIGGWVRGLVWTRRFQLLFVGMALAFAWYQLLAAYAVDLFAARGLTEAAASTAFGLIGGVSIISRIGGGYAADRIGARRGFLISLACAAAGVALLFAPQLPMLAPAIFLLGMGLGGSATLYIPLLLSVYDPEKDTAIVGIFNVAGGVGALAMPPLGAASVAYTNGYVLAVALTLGVTLVAIWAVVAGTR
nr:MFS transporter [Natranaeroarchaeum aerophilus]